MRRNFIARFQQLDHTRISLYELTISIFVSFVVMGVAFFYTLARIGFNVHGEEVLATTGITLFIIFLPLIFQFFGKKHQPFAPSIGKPGAITLLSIALLTGVSFVTPLIGYWLSSLFVLLGYLFFVLALILFFRHQKFYVVASLIFFALLLAIWTFGRAFSSYHSPLAFEDLVIGRATYDIFYHSSIMEMLRTYGIPSTGLDGTPYLPYHWGSHWIFARFSALLHLSSISVYNLVFPVMFLSIFYKSLLMFAQDIFLMFTRGEKGEIIPGAQFWIIFLLLHIGFLPLTFLYNWAVWESWIESESYLVGLLFLFLIGSLALYGYNDQSESMKGRMIYFISISIMLPLVGLTKISILVVALSVVIYIVLKLRLYKNWLNILVVVIALLFSYYILTITASTYTTNQENNNFYLFHFVKTFSLANWKGLFFYVHYFFTIAYIFLRVRELNITAENLKDYFKSNKILDIEILLVVSLMGLLPATLLRIDGGSAYYFTDIQARVSAAFLLFYLLKDAFYGKHFTRLTKSIGLLVPAVLIGALSNTFYQMEAAVNLNLSSRIEYSRFYTGQVQHLGNASPNILQYLSGSKSDIIPKLKELALVPQQGLEANEKYRFLSRLDSLGKLHTDEKRKLHIYIPRSNTAFWTELNGNPNTTAFIVPALTGISSIGGLPQTIDTYHYLNYGFHTYKEKIANDQYIQPPLDSICKNMQAKAVLVIPSISDMDIITCNISNP